MFARKVIDAVTRHVPLQEFDGSLNATNSSDDSTAVAKTISAIGVLCNAQVQKRLKVDVSSFVLILETSAESDGNSSGQDSGLQLVQEIAEAARAAAPTHACSSVLAGHASESDEYADVGLFLSAGSVAIESPEEPIESKARTTLSSLGLDSVHSSEIMPLPISSETNAPVCFKASVQDADVQHLSLLLAKLSHRFAFCVAVENVVFHFLLGQVPEGNAWAGLLGVGIWSD